MNLDISLVTIDRAFKALSGVASYLEKAAELTCGRWLACDIAAQIATGAYQLWLVFDKDTMKVLGVFVSEIKVYPRARYMSIHHCVIEANLMAQIEDKMQEYAAAFARDHGCTGVEFVGRPGWKRHAEKHGYASSSVVYQKMLEAA